MKLIVDRIEEGIVVCEKEDLSHINIPVSALPEGIQEGSVIDESNGKYYINIAEEEKRRKKILELQKKLFNNG